MVRVGERKVNCWEFMRCGREPGGRVADTEGVCPAAVMRDLDGVHGGVNAGRSCWVVSGTLARDPESGCRHAKNVGCMRCDFYEFVVSEEMTPEYRSGFHFTTQLQRKLKEERAQTNEGLNEG